MLFPVLLWTLSIIVKVSGKTIPVDFAIKEQNVNTDVLENRKSYQRNQFSNEDLFDKYKNTFQLDNSLHTRVKKVVSTNAPISVSTTSLSSLASRPSSSSSSKASEQQPRRTSSTIIPSQQSSSFTSSSQQTPKGSKSSSSSLRKRLQSASKHKSPVQEKSKSTAYAFNSRERKNGILSKLPRLARSSKVETSTTLRPTTTAKSRATNVTLHPSCLVLKRMKAKLPPGCLNAQNVMDPWS